jgi:hypothetical protein
LKAIASTFSEILEKVKSLNVGVGVGVGVDVGVATGVGDAVGVAEGFGATTFPPLPQTSFLPLLIQVYLKPFAIEVEFNLEQEAPVFTAANAGAETVEANREKHSKNNIPCMLRRFTDVIFDSP